MSKNKLFINFSLGLLLGVCVTNILFVLSTTLIFLSLCLFLLLGLAFLSKKHGVYIIIFGLGILFGSSLGMYKTHEISEKEQIISYYQNQTVSLTGCIQELYKEETDKKSYIIHFRIENKDINGLVYFKSNDKINIGDIYGISGKINLPQNQGNFNYIRFLETKNVYFIVYYGNHTLLGKNKRSSLETFINQIQSNLHNTIFRMYPENEAGLLSGLLFGEKTSLSEEIHRNFSQSGLSHIISVSGFNITIIILFLGYIFAFLPPIFRSIIITIFVIFFTLLVGYGLPVLRASMMGLLGYYILLSGRKAESLSLLLLSGVVLIMYNPLFLNYDLSFQLSFLAIIGLYYTEPFFKKMFHYIPNYIGIKESLVLTLSALSTTLPIMIFNFGQVSIIAPLANVLVGAMIPITMLFGFLALLGQYISQILGYSLGYIEYYFLHYILKVAEYLGNLKYSTLNLDLGIYAGYFEVLYFGILLFFILYFRQEKNPVIQDSQAIQEK